MSDAMDRPPTDDDAWSTACAEDLAAEKARRREHAAGAPGSAADELRKLADAVVDKLAELRNPAAETAARAVLSQVRAVGNQLKERNPGVFDHLAAAGGELLSAYRAAVAGDERRWTRTAASDAAATSRSAQGPDLTKDDGEGGAAPERIDLD